MAQLRLVGDPAEVEELLELLGRVAHLADVSRARSRYSATDVRVYAYLAPVVDGKLVADSAAMPSRAGRPVGSRPRTALGPGGRGQ